MDTPLEPGETLSRSGAANLKRGVEAVGGKLHLTDRRLVFEAHRLNFQRGSEIVPVGEITDVRRVWSGFLGIPLAPNGLAVTTRDGQERRYVLGRRGQWQAAIEEARLHSGVDL